MTSRYLVIIIIIIIQTLWKTNLTYIIISRLYFFMLCAANDLTKNCNCSRVYRVIRVIIYAWFFVITFYAGYIALSEFIL